MTIPTGPSTWEQRMRAEEASDGPHCGQVCSFEPDLVCVRVLDHPPIPHVADIPDPATGEGSVLIQWIEPAPEPEPAQA